MGRNADAIAAANAMLALAPKDAPTLYLRGLAKLRAGDNAGGTTDIRAADAVNPGVPTYFAKMGVAP